jgi:hypothetical protein
MTHRRTVLGAIVALAGMLVASVASAHHGWRWTEEGNIEVFGIVTSVQLGNPHGVLMLDVEGEAWRVEIGSPNRNARAGLEDHMLQVGMDILISGQSSADPDEKRVKAERVYIDGVEYNLYPNRD